MCVPFFSPAFGLAGTHKPQSSSISEAVELKGNARDLRVRLALLDPFQNPGSHLRVSQVGNRISFRPVVFQVA